MQLPIKHFMQVLRIKMIMTKNQHRKEQNLILFNKVQTSNYTAFCHNLENFKYAFI